MATTGGGAIRLARDPVGGDIFILKPDAGLLRIKPGEQASPKQVVATTDIVTSALPSGMAFGPDGALFVVANRTVGQNRTQAIIRRGKPSGDGFDWATLASTEPYPMSATPFDHLFNGIVASDDGKWVFVNSGSRTDHGEVEANNGAFPDLREVPLTSAIFRLPAGAQDLQLPNDEAGLKQYLFADGTRNAYDLAFAPGGELFATDTGPDADFPDELNLIREGAHYGFPWRFGNQDNPQQFAGYDASKDKHLSQDFTAVKSGTYHDDPGFPKPPAPFVDSIANAGPAAVHYRDDGAERDAAADGQELHTFTPHRSPLGLVFADSDRMPADLRGADGTLSAFVLSWGAAGGTLSDKGQDLLHMVLKRNGDSYTATTTQLAAEFQNPIDAVLIENRLYVLDFGKEGAIWELTFE
jgi:glucose/arabinose dehydrogenase